MPTYAENADVSFGETSLRKLFSPAEANRSLVLVRRIAEDVICGHASLLELQEMLEYADACGDEFRAAGARQSIVDSVEKLRLCLEELDYVGVEVREWASCVLDFPCMAGGREVRLCWRYGERRVGYWHEIGVGCEARRPIEQLAALQAIVT